MQAFTDLLKAGAWPSVVIFAVMWFGSPIETLLGGVGHVEVGTKGLVVDVREVAKQQGDPDLGKIIGRLSPTAIETMMDQPRNAYMQVFNVSQENSSRFFCPTESRLAALEELEREGLVVFTEPLTEFMEFVADLKPSFVSPDGFSVARAANVKEALSDAQIKRLNAQRYQLTDKGKKAVGIIVDSVVKQFARQT